MSDERERIAGRTLLDDWAQQVVLECTGSDDHDAEDCAKCERIRKRIRVRVSLAIDRCAQVAREAEDEALLHADQSKLHPEIKREFRYRAIASQDIRHKLLALKGKPMTERIRTIHLGDAGRGQIACGAKEKSGAILGKNWTWVPEKVTCKRCQVIYRMRVKP